MAATRQQSADPSAEVKTSQFCRCFGYISCGDCATDCCVNCNFISLCCNCSRCLQGTCQCFETIGCVKCCHKCGFDQACVNATCKKESPLCRMIFSGIAVMFTSLIAAGITAFLGMQYHDRAVKAGEMGEDYVCNSSKADDIAPDIKDAMDTMWYVYVTLTAGCFISCISGPLIVLRWVSIPFHLLFGAFFHMYGLFTLWRVRFSEAGDLCAAYELPGPIEIEVGDEELLKNMAPEDAAFIYDTFMLQCGMAVLFTLLASMGCYQERYWDRTTQKSYQVKNKSFRQNQEKAKKKMKQDQDVRHLHEATTELPSLAQQ